MRPWLKSALLSRSESYRSFVRRLPTVLDRAEVASALSGAQPPARLAGMGSGAAPSVQPPARLAEMGTAPSGGGGSGSSPARMPIPPHLAGVLWDADMEAVMTSSARYPTDKDRLRCVLVQLVSYRLSSPLSTISPSPLNSLN